MAAPLDYAQLVALGMLPPGAALGVPAAPAAATAIPAGYALTHTHTHTSDVSLTHTSTGGGMPPAPPSAPASVDTLPLAHFPVANNLFGILVAGRMVTTEWHIASETKFFAEISHPFAVGELSVFLLPGIVLPPDRGVVIHFAVPPFASWTTLGALYAAKPSEVFRTGWPTNPDVARHPVVRIAICVEPIEAIANVVNAATEQTWDKLAFVQLVARDLHRFLASCTQMTPVGERLVLPPDAVDKWYAKFQEKFRHDPNFLLRRKDEV